MAARSPGALGLFDPGAPKTSHRCTVVFTPALRTRRINGLLHVMLESLSSIQREWTATKDMHLVRPSSMRRYGIATGPSPPIPQPVTIAIAPFIGTGWRHDKWKSISGKEEFSDLCATCARAVLVVAAAGVFLLAPDPTLSLPGLSRQPRFRKAGWPGPDFALRATPRQASPAMTTLIGSERRKRLRLQ